MFVCCPRKGTAFPCFYCLSCLQHSQFVSMMSSHLLLWSFFLHQPGMGRSGVEWNSLLPFGDKFSALPAGEMCFLPNSRPLLREGSGVFHQRYIIILWSHSRGIFLGSFPYESLRAFYRGVSPHRSLFLTLTLVLTQPPATHRSHVRCSCSFAAPGSFCSRLSGAVSDVPFFSDFGKLFVL